MPAVDDAESRIETFLAKYTPDMAAQLREARARLRAAFPRGVEMVYDNYNALVFGIGPTERPSEAFISIAGFPGWVTLCFLEGIHLADPAGVLQGGGNRVRHVRLKSPADMAHPDIAALIAQAIARHASALEAAPPLRTLVKSVSAKQRPRRPVEAAPAGKALARKAPARKAPARKVPARKAPTRKAPA